MTDHEEMMAMLDEAIRTSTEAVRDLREAISLVEGKARDDEKEQ